MYELTEEELKSCGSLIRLVYTFAKQGKLIPINLYNAAKKQDPSYFHNRISYEVLKHGRIYRKVSPTGKRLFS